MCYSHGDRFFISDAQLAVLKKGLRVKNCPHRGLSVKILPQITGSTLRDRTDKDLAKACDDFLEKMEDGSSETTGIESNQGTEDDDDAKSSNAENA